jgi:ADP-dependent NAD(P)H-hydrate dehydratase / NAD(P)H-hydrate epimerase
MPNEATLLSVSQMYLADAITVESGLSAFDLMKNAGTSVADVILNRWPVQPVVVLCGSGNNGGDGFVVAQTLRSAGWPVRLALLGSAETLKNETARHASQWLGPIEPLSPAVLEDASIVVDAIFGSGLNRALSGDPLKTLQAAAFKNLTIVAIDIPSGISGDTGENLGAVQATVTITFFRKKPGHVLYPGRQLCGEIIRRQIGITDSVFADIAVSTFENQPSIWQSALPLITQQANKYHRGHALISGGYPLTGATKLAACATARIGAGLTTIAVPEIAFPAYAAGLMSVMIKPLRSGDQFDQLIADPRFSGFLIGPGAGIGKTTQSLTLKLLATGKPTVIDADAISSFEEHPDLLFEAIHGPCVLTPHEGEFRRLFSETGDKLSRARVAAQRSGAIIIIKGADTVIASPEGSAVINSNAPPTLATAGSGDVLSGIILGLVTQGMPPFLACCAAVWIHGEAANYFGPGLIADDLPDLIPKVMRALLHTNARSFD